MRLPIEKIVGLFGVKWSFCNIFIDKNFYSYGEIANISVHIDNSRVVEDCSLSVAQISKIYYKLPREAAKGKTDVFEHQWVVQKEVKGPLCRAGETRSMLIKFGIGRSKPNDFELRMDSDIDEQDYEYREQEIELLVREKCLFPRSVETEAYKVEHFFEFHLTHNNQAIWWDEPRQLVPITIVQSSKAEYSFVDLDDKQIDFNP